jgi:hypothetical protein
MLKDDSRLHIFVSYADEDVSLARPIVAELRLVFNLYVRITFAPDIPLGHNWRATLDDALDRADILLIVATGRQKPSHSFTGSEVGFFRNSQRHTPRMRGFDSDRIILTIPIGTTKVPEPAADIMSVKPLVAEPEMLGSEEEFIAKVGEAGDNPLIMLFERILSVIKKSPSLPNNEPTPPLDAQIRASATRLLKVLFNELCQRVSTEVFPERKIMIRLGPTSLHPPGGDPLAGASITFFGNSFDIFGLHRTQAQDMPFSNFISSLHSDAIGAAWSEAVKTLVVAARENDFGENRRLLASTDQTRFFRLFVARSVLYYSGVTEIHIYIVEVKSRDYGDPRTSMLLKALSVGLQYRFMFLDETSPFSPAAISTTMIKDLRPRVSALLQEIDVLLWISKDAGLGQAENLLVIWGNDLSKNIDTMAELWEREKNALYESALKLVGTTDNIKVPAMKTEFVAVLTKFCKATSHMNMQFTSRVLDALQKIVGAQQGAGRELHGS